MNELNLNDYLDKEIGDKARTLLGQNEIAQANPNYARSGLANVEYLRGFSELRQLVRVQHDLIGDGKYYALAAEVEAKLADWSTQIGSGIDELEKASKSVSEIMELIKPKDKPRRLLGNFWRKIKWN